MIADLVKQRAVGYINYMAAVEGVEESLRVGIQQKIRDKTVQDAGQVPDHSQVPTDDALKAELRVVVDEAYAFENENHPFRRVVQKSGNFYTDGLLSGVLFPHATMAKTYVGDQRMMARLKGAAEQSRQTLENKFLWMAAEDIVEQGSLDELKQHLSTTYGGINEHVLAMADSKEKLVSAYVLDILRVAKGSARSTEEIEDAILGRGSTAIEL